MRALCSCAYISRYVTGYLYEILVHKRYIIGLRSILHYHEMYMYTQFLTDSAAGNEAVVNNMLTQVPSLEFAIKHTTEFIDNPGLQKESCCKLTSKVLRRICTAPPFSMCTSLVTIQMACTFLNVSRDDVHKSEYAQKKFTFCHMRVMRSC